MTLWSTEDIVLFSYCELIKQCTPWIKSSNINSKRLTISTEVHVVREMGCVGRKNRDGPFFR